MNWRDHLAISAGRAASTAVRLSGKGSGTVIAGHVARGLCPEIVDRIGRGRRAVLVTGTNGKTTTTALVAAGLGSSVTSNRSGSNLWSGVLTALIEGDPAVTAVLEVDEGTLPAVLKWFDHPIVALLNLSRDQLDRYHETRIVADRWRTALAARAVTVVANADDPLVVWAASGLADVRWVGVGLGWIGDSGACPSCGRSLDLTIRRWGCQCGLRRPAADWELDGATLTGDGVELELRLRLPGRCNLANAAMAVVAAGAAGADPVAAASAAALIDQVAGRYWRTRAAETDLTILLAKNPAGWQETLDMIEQHEPWAGLPVVIAVHADTPDGLDPSWLWDVPFERLRGRVVHVCGRRALDLAVRLRYAEVDFVLHRSAAESILGRLDANEVIVVASYSAFDDLVRVLRA